MGMDYIYAGSASYPRFNDEVKGIVELFGGKMVTNRKPQEECNIIEYFMEKPLKYSFPDGTNKIFMKWANDPFESLTEKETKELINFMKPKWEEARKISDQIIYELECLDDDSGWCISD